jgi:hypothetical protein
MMIEMLYSSPTSNVGCSYRAVADSKSDREELGKPRWLSREGSQGSN